MKSTKIKKFRVCIQTRNEGLDTTDLFLNRKPTLEEFDRLLRRHGFENGDTLEACWRRIKHDIQLTLKTGNEGDQFIWWNVNTSGEPPVCICQAAIKRAFGHIPKHIYIRKGKP